MTIKLIYSSSLYGRPHVAEATVQSRLTPKQIIVAWQQHPQIVYVNGHTRGPTGISDMRFWRRHGRRVGGEPRMGSWCLAPGELERLNADDDPGSER